jgi:hypothetical protein
MLAGGRSRPDNRSACSVPTSANAHPAASRALARTVGNSDVFCDMGSAWAAADAISRAAVSAVLIARSRVTFDLHQQLAPVA